MKNILITIAIISIFTSCNDQTKSIEETTQKKTETIFTLTDAQIKNADIKTSKAEERKISSILKVNGKIDVPPQNMISISMPLGGFLKSTNLLPGMRIKKGEVIAVMEDEKYIQLQQEYLTAKAKLVYLENEYNRQKELNQSKASSDKIYQQTMMDYNSQKINTGALAEKLKLINIKPENLNETNISKNTNIYAPIDGFVSQVNINVGKYVNPSDVMFELVNPDDIHLNLKIFEKDIDKLSIGQKVIAFNNNQPEKKYPGDIILISQNLSQERSIDVHCHFDAYDKSLMPGMYMNAEISILSNNSLTIDNEAIVSFEGKEYIFAANSEHDFELIEILKGNSENGFTEISTIGSTDLKQRQIVINKAYSLLMTMKNKAEE